MTPDIDQSAPSQPGATHLPSDSDYERFQPHVRSWASVPEFTTAASWEPGVHVVHLDSGSHIDILIQGDPRAVRDGDCLLVVFSGAMSQRNNAPGPFFSGVALAQALGAPLVSISDPLLNVDTRLRLGWYTGRAHENVQWSIRVILETLGARLDRELLLVGGSGGGFTALHHALRLGVPASAFVWNPQTDLLDYEATAVREYLAAALGLQDDAVDTLTREERAVALTLGNIDHSALPAGELGTGLRRLLYLQNASDGHVSQHMAPFLLVGGYSHVGNGRWKGPNDELVLVSAVADGHEAPPRAILERGLKGMMACAIEAGTVVDDLQAEGLVPTSGLEVLPRDLRAESSTLSEHLSLSAERDPSGRISLRVMWRDIPHSYGGIVTRFGWTEPSGQRTTRLEASNATTVDDPTGAIQSTRATVLDGFRNAILYLEADVVRVSR